MIKSAADDIIRVNLRTREWIKIIGGVGALVAATAYTTLKVAGEIAEMDKRTDRIEQNLKDHQGLGSHERVARELEVIRQRIDKIEYEQANHVRFMHAKP